MHIPKITTTVKTMKPITIAVIDDAFRLSHEIFKKHIYENPREITDNLKDDDNNGYVDDINGWDISDNDGNVNIPKDRESAFYHGTMIASTILMVLNRACDNSSLNSVKILPVKVLSDQAQNGYLADGYKGIRYAIDQGADIICCAWSGGTASLEERSLIAEAQKKGIIVIGSVGNLNMEKVYPPASMAGVIAVTAIDTNFHKTKIANYGMRTDLCAPGDKVLAATSFNDTDLTYGDGTSAATALVTGAIAVLKLAAPSANNELIIESLFNTTEPLEKQNVSYAGKLGSGMVNLNRALQYLTKPESRSQFFNPTSTKGSILIHKGKNSLSSWEIAPYGSYQNIHLSAPNFNDKYASALIQINTKDSAYYRGPLSTLRRGLSIPQGFAKISFPNPKKMPKNLSLTYFVETIDSSTLYCNENRHYEQSSGTIEDGSGTDNYANKSTCKWQINAPMGKRIKIEFPEMDTEANTDFVWIFDGDKTIPDYLIAKFSGSSIPPTVVSRTHQVLVWFVSNESITKAGWKLNYKIVD